MVGHEDKAMLTLDYDRNDLDHYPTPEWVSEAIAWGLNALNVPISHVWEPACGTGDMADVLKRHYDVVSSDVKDYGYPGASQIDFLGLPPEYETDRAIITNPPYGDDAERFIRMALHVTKEHQQVVVMVLRHEYDCAATRSDLFRHPSFRGKIVLTSRPRWIVGTKGAPRHNYAIFVWDWKNKAAPTIVYHRR